MSAVLPKVFISYRRSDSLSATGRLYDRLNTAFPGMFFRDVSGIGIGVDFTKEIERAVSSSVALIAVIGPTWATDTTELISQLEGEVASDTRRSTAFRWTAGAVAAVIVAIVATGALVVWLVRAEFADATETGLNVDAGLVDPVPADIEPPEERVTPPAARPRANADPTPAAPQALAQNAAPFERRGRGFGFPGRGRWRMTAQANQALSIALDLDSDDGTFEVSIPAGVMNMPLSGGNYTYDDSTGMLQVSGVDNGGRFFNEFMQIFEREDDHFHVRYQGAVWELTSAE